MTEKQCSYKTKKHLINIIKGQKCSNCNFAILFGAGASISSKVKSSKQMIEEMRVQFFKNEEIKEPFEKWLGNQKWYNKSYEYSQLFELIYDSPTQRREYIEDCIEGRVPSWGYIYLANLIEKGYFNVVFTTNFDDLVNEACLTYTECKPIVCAHDSAVSGIRIRSKRPKIIKLHGDFLFDNLKNTVEETENLERNMREKLSQFAKEYGLVIVGYSGNDNSIMDTLEMLIRTQGCFPHGLYWCKLKESSLSDRAERLLNKANTHLVEIDGFDELMAELHEALNLELPIAVKDPYVATTRRLNNFVDLKIENEIIKRDMSALDATIEKFTSSIRDNERGSNIRPFYYQGVRAMISGKYKIGADYLEKALEQEPYNFNTVARLADVYLILDDPVNAKKYVDLLEKLTPKVFDQYTDMLSAFLKFDPERALHKYDEAFKLATKVDDKSYLHILFANCYLKLKQFDKAIVETDKSLKLNSMEAWAKLNKAIAIKRLGDKAGAEGIAKEVLTKIKGRSFDDYYLKACIFAILENIKELAHSLKMMKSKNKVLTILHFKFDPDFEGFRERQELQTFIDIDSPKEEESSKK
jgi:tetratricopeptide (TPR) repeat protein